MSLRLKKLIGTESIMEEIFEKIRVKIENYHIVNNKILYKILLNPPQYIEYFDEVKTWKKENIYLRNDVVYVDYFFCQIKTSPRKTIKNFLLYLLSFVLPYKIKVLNDKQWQHNMDIYIESLNNWKDEESFRYMIKKLVKNSPLSEEERKKVFEFYHEDPIVKVRFFKEISYYIYSNNKDNKEITDIIKNCHLFYQNLEFFLRSIDE